MPTRDKYYDFYMWVDYVCFPRKRTTRPISPQFESNKALMAFNAMQTKMFRQRFPKNLPEFYAASALGSKDKREMITFR